MTHPPLQQLLTRISSTRLYHPVLVVLPIMESIKSPGLGANPTAPGLDLNNLLKKTGIRVVSVPIITKDPPTMLIGKLASMALKKR